MLAWLSSSPSRLRPFPLFFAAALVLPRPPSERRLARRGAQCANAGRICCRRDDVSPSPFARSIQPDVRAQRLRGLRRLPPSTSPPRRAGWEGRTRCGHRRRSLRFCARRGTAAACSVGERASRYRARDPAAARIFYGAVNAPCTLCHGSERTDSTARSSRFPAQAATTGSPLPSFGRGVHAPQEYWRALGAMCQNQGEPAGPVLRSYALQPTLVSNAPPPFRRRPAEGHRVGRCGAHRGGKCVLGGKSAAAAGAWFWRETGWVYFPLTPSSPTASTPRCLLLRACGTY